MMKELNERPIGDARELIRALRGLGEVEAPEMLPAVLVRVGLCDAYWTLETPLGPVYVAYNTLGVAAVTRAATPVEFEARFRSRFGRAARRMSTPPAELLRLVERQLRGEAPRTLRFDLRGISEFERAVLLKALEIPRGEVRPYAWVAREIGRPGAVRAVGSALADNPIPLLIPCHRVVRSDGSIGQYSLGGTDDKRVILAAEGVDPAGLETLARAGVRFIGNATSHSYCFPTCRFARRLSEQRRVTFSSEAQAAAAGYHPCSACRPARAS